MKVHVVFDYESMEKVEAHDLRRLIEEKRIIAFRRVDGWVRIGTDPIRGAGGEYEGPERRSFAQNRLKQTDRGFHPSALPPKKTGEGN